MLFVPRGAGHARQVPSEGTTRLSATYGIALTPSTSSFSAATWVAFFSNAVLDDDAHEIEIRISNTGADATSREIAVEIGIDRAGGTTYVPIVPGLMAGGAFGYNVSDRTYVLPLFIPKGATIAARAYSSAATGCRVAIFLRGRPQQQVIQRAGTIVEAVGLSGFAGATIVPGTTNKGTRVLLGTTTRSLWHWSECIQIDDADTSWTNNAFHVDLEYSLDSGTTFLPIIYDAVWRSTSGELLYGVPSRSHCFVPAGAGVYARMQMSAAGGDTYTIVAYGTG